MPTLTVMPEAKELADLLVGSPDQVETKEILVMQDGIEGKTVHYIVDDADERSWHVYTYSLLLPDGRALEVCFNTPNRKGEFPRSEFDKLVISVKPSARNKRGFDAGVSGLTSLAMFRRYSGPDFYFEWSIDANYYVEWRDSYKRAPTPRGVAVDSVSNITTRVPIRPVYLKQLVHDTYLGLIKDVTAVMKGEQKNITMA